MKDLITFQNAAFGYDRTPIIRNLSLCVPEGAFIGIVGPNGAGKSTLFKGLVGLLPPMAGSLHRAASLTRRIGYVPQRDQLDPLYPLTAEEVVTMGLVGILPWYRYPDKIQQARVMSSLDQVGMRSSAGQSFASLSGGQRQRVLIARALVIDPLLLVLDEPTAGIDPQAEIVILDLLQTLHQQGKSILMVSHRDMTLRKHVKNIWHVEDGGVQV